MCARIAEFVGTISSIVRQGKQSRESICLRVQLIPTQYDHMNPALRGNTAAGNNEGHKS
jgi:hypothetical protein